MTSTTATNNGLTIRHGRGVIVAVTVIGTRGNGPGDKGNGYAGSYRVFSHGCTAREDERKTEDDSH